MIRVIINVDTQKVNILFISYGAALKIEFSSSL